MPRKPFQNLNNLVPFTPQSQNSKNMINTLVNKIQELSSITRVFETTEEIRQNWASKPKDLNISEVYDRRKKELSMLYTIPTDRENGNSIF